MAQDSMKPREEEITFREVEEVAFSVEMLPPKRSGP